MTTEPEPRLPDPFRRDVRRGAVSAGVRRAAGRLLAALVGDDPYPPQRSRLDRLDQTRPRPGAAVTTIAPRKIRISADVAGKWQAEMQLAPRPLSPNDREMLAEIWRAQHPQTRVPS